MVTLILFISWKDPASIIATDVNHQSLHSHTSEHFLHIQ